MGRRPKKTGAGNKADVALFAMHPLADAAPIANFMCFRTPDDDVFIRCEWNPVERRYNLNCHAVGIDECRGGA